MIQADALGGHLSSATRTMPLLGMLVVAAFALTACDSTIPAGDQVAQSVSTPSPGETALSNLSDVERLRDQIARSESAVAASATKLELLATECDSCSASLHGAAASANDRLDLVGGVWEPWANISATDASELPQLPPVGDAPLLPVELAGYMYATSTEQLAYAHAIRVDNSEEALLFASVVSGRLLSAEMLAFSYDADAAEAAESLPEGATATAITDSSGPSSLGGIEPDNSDSQSGSGKVEDQTAAAVRAEQRYDCIGSSLGLSGLSMLDAGLEQSLYDDLLSRRLQLETSIMEDTPLRCVFSDSNSDALINELLAVDLELLVTGDDRTSSLALEWLQADIHLAAKLGSVVPVAPGIERSEGAIS